MVYSYYGLPEASSVKGRDRGSSSYHHLGTLGTLGTVPWGSGDHDLGSAAHLGTAHTVDV